jgi:hypothetical protein
VVVRACNPCTWVTETGGSWVWGQPRLCSEFQASMNYIDETVSQNQQQKWSHFPGN